ncbi:MAG TPA: hypothetical protein VFV28_01590, partial [Limnobacter sp.]|nr:hypothetical protein [Limnobacter sp.]
MAVPTAKAAVVGALSTFSAALGKAGAAVGAHATAIAGGAVAAGALNILDGFRAYRKGDQKIREYAKEMNDPCKKASASAFG